MDGENWDFSPLNKIHPTDATGKSHPIVFLAWNSPGSDLACIDVLGNISIYSTSNTQLGAFNCHLTPGLSTATPEPQELNSVIGFKWLEPEKTVLIANPATLLPTFEAYIKNSGTSNNQTNLVAQYSYCQAQLYGPHVPLIPSLPKQACIALTRRGTIRLFTQGISDARYFEVSASVDQDGIIGEPVLFSHASFAGSKDNTLLLAAYSSQNEYLYIYKLVIEWPALTAAASRSPNPNKSTNHLATIQTKRLLRTKITPQVNNSFYLSHLLLLPAGLAHIESDIDAELQIVFSSPKNQSVVQRYDLVTKTVALHNNFFSLSFRRDSLGNVEETQTCLVASDPVEYPKPVINLGSFNFDSFICISFADGTVDMKHRPHYINRKTTSSPIHSLMTVGFQFTPLEVVTDMCVSQNLASALYLDKSGKLCISYMRNPKLAPISPNKQTPNQAKQSNIIIVVSAIALAVRHAALCFANTCSDDLVIVMKREHDRIAATSPEAAQNFLRTLLRESYRAVSFALDISKDTQIDKIIVNPSLQRLLSMQVTLGTSIGWKRNSMGRMAWSILNLRILAFAFTFTLRAVNQSRQHNSSGQSEFDLKSGYFMSMVGLTRWCIDLMAYICQELYMASIETDKYSYFQGKTSVAAAILLGKIPRMLLNYSLRGIRGMDQLSQKLAEEEPNHYTGSIHIAVRKLREITLHFSPVSLEFFEKLVSDVDKTLNTAYPNLSDRMQVEHDLIFFAQVPQDLAPAITRTVDIFSKHVPTKINVPWLYFYDVSWLGLNESTKDDSTKAITNLQETPTTTSTSPPIPISLHPNIAGRRLSVALQSFNKDPFSGRPTAGPNSDPNAAYEPKPLPSGGQEIDYVRKQEMSKYSVGVGTRCRCSRCGEVSIWYNPKPQASAYWTVACQKVCICGGAWVPLE